MTLFRIATQVQCVKLLSSNPFHLRMRRKISNLFIRVQYILKYYIYIQILYLIAFIFKSCKAGILKEATYTRNPKCWPEFSCWMDVKWWNYGVCKKTRVYIFSLYLHSFFQRAKSCQHFFIFPSFCFHHCHKTKIWPLHFNSYKKLKKE